MQINENYFPILNPNVTYNKLNVGAIISYIREDNNLVINNTEAFIVSLCNGENSTTDIINNIYETYQLQDSEEEVKNSIINFLQQLVKRKFIFISKEKLCLEQLAYLNTYSDFTDFDIEYTKPKNMQVISISIIDNCPLKCIYCLADAPDVSKNNKIMSFEKIREILREAKMLGARGCLLSGGEPLAHPDIFKIIQEVYNLGYHSLRISTKATLITKEFASNLRQAGLHQIQVSIDSTDPELYEKMVGKKGTYKKMMQGLYHLLYYGFDVNVVAVVTKYNVHDIPNLCIDLLNNGIEKIVADVIYPIGRGQVSMCPTKEEITWLEDKLGKVQVAWNLKNSILNYISYGKPKPCAGAINVAYVFPNGEVSFCDRVKPILDQVSFGNVYNNSLIEIWNSDRINSFRKLRTSNQVCVECDIAYKCLGGCVINSWLKFNDCFQPDPLCNIVYKEGGIFLLG